MLSEIRNNIDEIDKEMAVLFEKRMDLVKQVIEYKKVHSLPVFDPSREKKLFDNNLQYISEEYKEYYMKFLEYLIYLSKEYQNGQK